MWKKGKKNKITELSSIHSPPAAKRKCFGKTCDMLCIPALSALCFMPLYGIENRHVEWSLRQREAIFHSSTTCCSTSVTNSRAECLLSVNESLICCTMEMGRRVCDPHCFLHQCLALSQTALHEPTLIFSNRSLKEYKPETSATASWIAPWCTFIRTAGLRVT